STRSSEATAAAASPRRRSSRAPSTLPRRSSGSSSSASSSRRREKRSQMPMSVPELGAKRAEVLVDERQRRELRVGRRGLGRDLVALRAPLGERLVEDLADAGVELVARRGHEVVEALAELLDELRELRPHERRRLGDGVGRLLLRVLLD